MGNFVFNPGGDHGVYCVQQLENLIGTPGLTGVLLITALAFLTYFTAETIYFIRKLFNPVTYLAARIPFSVTNNNPSEEEEYEVEEEEKEPIEEKPKKEEKSPVVDLTEFTMNENRPIKPIDRKPSNRTTNNPDSPLTVEVGQKGANATGNRLNDADLSTPINPREPYLRYKFPTLDLLKKYNNDGKPEVDMDEIKANNKRIVEVLNSFGVDIKEIKATVGPTITLYEITPAEGVRISKIRNLEDDIALSLSALGIRIIAPIPGKGTIGIEVPNKKANIVSMESILNSRKFQETKMELPIALGKTITNDVYMADLAKIPHLLVAGATGQGKSVGLNAIITSLLYKKHPNELKFVLIDPKKVEFTTYTPIANHFMATLPENEEEPIITDVTKVVRTLNSLCKLMDTRYDLLKLAGVRNIKEYNEKYVNHQLNLTHGHEYMPYIVVIIDEFGDLIMTAGKEVELPIARIAQLARAVGIHMIIATQRPTTNIITGTIKANFPGRMAFKVTSMIDSRTILDRPGANQLIGRGDMLIINGTDPIRVQCAFVDTPEVERINKYVEEQPGPIEPMELPEPAAEESAGGNGTANVGTLDPFFEEAAHAVVITQQGSTSMIQRRFSIGYNRAGRLMDQLEAAGIVGPAMGSKPRDVLVVDENSLNMLIAKLKT
jgi:S-DNA-T family DNA segregation ATPase FtsK/SpoIIIE